MAIEQFGMLGLVLMENAGRGAAEWIDQLAPPGNLCILCGKGNNAGDGYVIARHLELAGRELCVVSVCDTAELTGDAAANHQIAKLSGIAIHLATDPASLRSTIGNPQTIVDCLLGTGSVGPPREPIASAIRIANQLDAHRIAIDLPSGLDCDSGQANDPTFQAAETITFVAMKRGFLASPQASTYTGRCIVVSIGVPKQLLMLYGIG